MKVNTRGCCRMLMAWATLSLGAALAQAADLDAVHRRGVLRVLMVTAAEANSSPGPGVDAGGFDPQSRFDRELLDGFARLHNVRIELVTTNGYDRLIPALIEDKGDLIAGAFTVTEARKKLIDFTTEAFPSRDVVLSRKPQPAITTLDALRALTKVGAVRGSSEWQALLDAGVPAAAIGPLGSVTEDLRAGRFPAVVAPVEQAMDAARSDPELQIGIYVGPSSSYAYGARKQDAALKAALSEYVANLRRGGGWSRLVVKHYGEGAAEILKKIRE